VKPPLGGNSCGVYLTTIDKIPMDLWNTHVIQEYIQSDKEYAGYFVVKKGKIMFSFAYLRHYGNRIYIKGDSLDKTTQERIEIVSRHINVFEQFLLPLKYTGACCIDYKIVDGIPIVLEINPRLGGSLSFPQNRRDAADVILKLIEVFY
jgi:hypothetical protein